MVALRVLAVSLMALALWPSDTASDDVLADEVLSTTAVAPAAADGQGAPSDSDSVAGSDQVDTTVTAAGVSVPSDDTRPTLTIARLWSPAPNIVRIDGSLDVTTPTPFRVSIDGAAIGQILVEPDNQGVFSFELPNLDSGSKNLCLDDVCGQVMITDEAMEQSEIVAVSIREAIAIAMTRFDVNTHLPGWSIEPTTQNAGATGYTIAEAKAILISASPAQSIEEITTTVLHEIAHAIDATYVDDEERQQFRALRGHPADMPWSQPVDHGAPEGRWLDGAEDFAEVFIAWVNEGDYVTKSRVAAPQPSSADLDAFCGLIETATIACTTN